MENTLELTKKYDSTELKAVIIITENYYTMTITNNNGKIEHSETRSLSALTETMKDLIEVDYRF